MRPFNRNRKKFLLIPFGAVAILALVSYIVMQLWNNLLPDILHVSVINFWQAMGIFVLSKILFGFGRGGRGGAPWMRGKRMMEEKFSNLSPEDRERFRDQMRNRCGWGRRGEWRDTERPAEAETKAE